MCCSTPVSASACTTSRPPCTTGGWEGGCAHCRRGSKTAPGCVKSSCTLQSSILRGGGGQGVPSSGSACSVVAGCVLRCGGGGQPAGGFSSRGGASHERGRQRAPPPGDAPPGFWRDARVSCHSAHRTTLCTATAHTAFPPLQGSAIGLLFLPPIISARKPVLLRAPPLYPGSASPGSPTHLSEQRTAASAWC
jgi:hypothetical protein